MRFIVTPGQASGVAQAASLLDGQTGIAVLADKAYDTVIGTCKGRHRSTEFRAFLDQVEAAVPTDLDVHLMLVNASTYETRLLHDWLLKRPPDACKTLPFRMQHQRWYRLLMVERECMEGGALRALRHQLRLSQIELAAKLNSELGRSYDRPKLSRWESGRDSIPDDVAQAVSTLVSAQPRNARVLAMANQKGGVGKTTSALNLSYALAQLGQRVLLIDLDPQATATSVLFGRTALELHRTQRTIAHVLMEDTAIDDAVVRAGGLVGDRSAPFDFVASHIHLSGIDLRREPGFDAALQDSLEDARNIYDFIVIDAPPNLGVLTWMALGASDLVIVPVQTEPYDAMGVSMILDTIRKVQRRLNPGLRIAGILPTRYSASLAIDREVLTHLISEVESITPIIEPVPNSTVYSHAAWASRITLEASPRSKVVQVYVRIAAALIDGTSLPRAAIPGLRDGAAQPGVA